MSGQPILRVARPSDNLEALVPFYQDGLGIKLLSRFQDHDGFDGLIFGEDSAPYHLEFTRAHGLTAGRAPTADNLLVFYLPEWAQWEAAIRRMLGAGFEPVPAFNPYWDRNGRTYEDPDGYRSALQHSRWALCLCDLIGYVRQVHSGGVMGIPLRYAKAGLTDSICLRWGRRPSCRRLHLWRA